MNIFCMRELEIFSLLYSYLLQLNLCVCPVWHLILYSSCCIRDTLKHILYVNNVNKVNATAKNLYLHRRFQSPLFFFSVAWLMTLFTASTIALRQQLLGISAI